MVSNINNRPTLSQGTLFFAGKKNKSKTQSQPAQTPPAPVVPQAMPQSPPKQPAEALSEEITPARSEDNRSTDSTHSAPPEQGVEIIEPDVLNDLDVIDKSELSETEYARQTALEEKALFEAIGRRFAIPGRALNSAENYAKSWSRTLIDKTKTIIHQTKHAVNKKTAATLRSWANSLAPEQD